MGDLYLKVLRVVLKDPEGTPGEQAREMARKFEGELKVEQPDARQVRQEIACPEDTAGGSEGRAEEAGVLWLTDCEEIAAQLAEKKCPVMAWLHEGNRQDSFPEIRYATLDPQEADADFYDKIYRRFAGIPWEIAETPRCVIRETVVGDVDAFVTIYQEPEITRYTDSFCMEPDCERQYVKEYIEKVYEFFGYGVWTVLWKETGEVIGRVGFEQPVTEKDAEDESIPLLGYMIALPWQGKGIAEEVCRAALAFAEEELGFEAVQVVIDTENAASLKLAAKLGFEGNDIMTEQGGRIFRGVLKLERLTR